MSEAPELLLSVDGMFCSSCARAAERQLSKVPGVIGVQVGFVTGVASLRLGPSAGAGATEAAALQALGALGYPSRPYLPAAFAAPNPAAEAEATALAQRLAIAWLAGMWVMIAQLVLYLHPGLSLSEAGLLARFSGVLATPVVFVSGWRFHLAAWRTLRAGAPGMDLLVSLGAIGAWALSWIRLAQGGAAVWFDAATMLISLLLLGRLLEARARRRGMDAVRGLLDLSPERVEVWRPEGEGGAFRWAPAAAVDPGARVRVQPQARFALDGVVRVGHSEVVRAAMTGEARPVAVGPGDGVEAGCTNGGGVLEIEVTGVVGQRALDRVAAALRAALDQRTEDPGLAARWSERLVPVVLALSALTGGARLLGGAGWVEATAAALTVLVVTCPCALGLAVPLARVAAMGQAARRGLLFTSPAALERAAAVDTVVLDKTGTLTEGRPRLRAISGPPGDENNVRNDVLLHLAASASAGGAHPLSDAIAALGPVERGGEREQRPGAGVRWRFAGREVCVGSAAWLGAPEAPADDPDSVVWVSQDGALVGALRFADPLRPEAPQSLAALSAAGLGLHLWSGDAEGPVRAAAAAVGQPALEARWGLRPEEKEAGVRALRAAGRVVAFVGDGINDAPALARADLGVAVRQATDAARAAAELVVRGGGLEQVVVGLHIARVARRRARQNLAWAFVYNGIALPLAVGGWLSPGQAAVAMVFSSLSVTLNAARALPPTPGLPPSAGAVEGEGLLGPHLQQLEVARLDGLEVA